MVTCGELVGGCIIAGLILILFLGYRREPAVKKKCPYCEPENIMDWESTYGVYRCSKCHYTIEDGS